MTPLSRLFTRSVFVLLASTAIFGPAAAQTFDVHSPSVTGNFLAGQQALTELRTREAARFLLDAAEAEWDNQLLVERAFLALAIDGQVEIAANVGRHLLELDPSYNLARLVVGTVAIGNGNYREALTVLQPIGQDNLIDITGELLRSWAHVGSGKGDLAQIELNDLAEAGLETFLLSHRALMAEVSGNKQGALDFARRIYEIDPTATRSVETYARLLGEAGNFDEALDIIDRYQAEGLNHAIVEAVRQDIVVGHAPGPFARDVQSGAAKSFFLTGQNLAGERATDLAILFFHLGRYLDPTDDVQSLALGQMLDVVQRHDEANAIYNAIPADSPIKSVAVVRIAQNLSAMGDRPEAIRRLSNVVQTTPEDADAILALADLQRLDEQYEAAIETYTRVIDLDPADRPNDWRFYYLRGIAYERAGRFEEGGEADFLKALELNPDQPQVLNYLGYTWVDKGMNLERALEMIEKAVALAPNDGMVVDSLGWAYYKLGRFEEAVVTLEKAVMLEPVDPEINDHLGDAYWMAGRQLEAMFQWNVATSVDEIGIVTERAAPKLANGLTPPAPAPTPPPASEALLTH